MAIVLWFIFYLHKDQNMNKWFLLTTLIYAISAEMMVLLRPK